MMTVAALAIFFFISIGGFVLSKDFYAIGVAPDGPSIHDQRFMVIPSDHNIGEAMLGSRMIDLYITGDSVLYRNDSRSLYAAGALKQYLEKKELSRIANEYDMDYSFPLRVEVNYLHSESDTEGETASITLSDLLNARPDLPEANESDSATMTYSADGNYSTEEVLARQLQDLDGGDNLHQFKAEFAGDKEIIVPSLMNPPIPLAQVLLAFFYIVPIFFIIIFFTSSFIEEKLNKRLSILLSAPVRPAEIILGKMLPYFIYSVIVIIGITLFLKGNVGLALAIFIPVVLFILAIYLGVALCYRTFKDQSFFSMLAVTMVTGFLVFPAMFTGINKLSYISPLSLAVLMYKGETFSISEYFFSTAPMYLIFGLAMLISVRVFNEEYLLNFKPLRRKISEAIFFALHKRHIKLSIFILSLLLIPVVFMVELSGIILASNFPMPLAIWLLLLIGVVVEELAKSCGIAVLIQNSLIKSWKNALILGVIAAAAFFLGEKLLMLLSMTVISESMLTNTLLSGNMFLWPLLLHVFCTATVSLVTYRMGAKYYPVALVIASCIHLAYNITVMGIMR